MNPQRLRTRLLGVLLVLTLAASCAPSNPAGGDEPGGDEEDASARLALPLRAAPGLNISADPAPPPATPPAAPTAVLPIPDPPQAAVPGGFAAVTAGWGYTCGLRGDGGAECWRWGKNGSEPRADAYPWNTPPTSHRPWTFADEARTTGRHWDSSPQAAQPPAGAFVAVSAGRDAACGLRPNGEIQCWGQNLAITNPPEGTFTAVSAGIEHACALRPSGQTECWGTSSVRGNATTPPEGQYTDIATGYNFACALKAENNTAQCWGPGFTTEHDSTTWGQGVIPPGEFTTIDAGRLYHICGLRKNGAAECWASFSPEHNPYLTPPEGEFLTINVRGGLACGMRPGGKHECWGKNGWIFPVAEGDFLTVVRSGGGYWSEACGALRSGGVECWDLSTWTEGDELPETRRDADGVFVRLSTSDSHKCGLRPSGEVECWSAPWVEDHPVWEPPEGVFVDVSSGADYACGLRPDWSVECWGSEYYGRATPPAGAFVKVSASTSFTCGLRPSGEVECWGDAFLQSKILPPTEPLTAVSAGWGGYQFYRLGSAGYSPIKSAANDWGYTCGLRPDRTVRCWGDSGTTNLIRSSDRPQILDPPKREFLKVETGRRHACGLRADGKIECWGNGLNTNYDYTRAGVYPEELRTNGPRTYTDLSVGGTYTCGLRSDDGAIECWDDAGTAVFQQKGPYTTLSAGYTHQCGLLTTGDIRCWEITPNNNPPWTIQTYTPTPQQKTD